MTVAAFVASCVVFHGSFSLLAAGNTGPYHLVFQPLSEPVGVVASVAKMPIDLGQAAEQRPCSDIAADLTGGDNSLSGHC